MECSDSGRVGAAAEIWRRSDLDDGAIGSRCVGTEEATKVLSRGSSCADEAIGRIGGDVVVISWSLSHVLISGSAAVGDLVRYLGPALAQDVGFNAEWVRWYVHCRL